MVRKNREHTPSDERLTLRIGRYDQEVGRCVLRNHKRNYITLFKITIVFFT